MSLNTEYINGQVLSIMYDVWISGTQLDLNKKACITSIDTKETVDGADIATLNISDPEFLFIEDNIFLEDNPIKIEMGWDNTTYREKFEGYIPAIDIDFGEDGIPNLTVTCMDNTHKMNRDKKNNTFTNCTNADVVKKITASYGYTCVVEKDYAFTKHETITQSDQTDIDFIQKLASDEVYPFTARLVGNTFYYVKKGHLGIPKMTLTYMQYPHEIISFSPKINKETKKVEIESSKVDTSSKKVSTSKGTIANTGSGSASKGNEPSGSSTVDNTSTTSKSGYTYNPATRSWTKN